MSAGKGKDNFSQKAKRPLALIKIPKIELMYAIFIIGTWLSPLEAPLYFVNRDRYILYGFQGSTA